MIETQRIAFLGGGVMAGAILRALLASGRTEPSRVTVSDPLEQCRQACAALGVGVTAANREAVAGADVVVVAVKPQVVQAVLEEVGGLLNPSQLVLSIAAGVTTAELERSIPSLPVIRAMPNTPFLVGAGAAAFCRGAQAGEGHAALAREILGSGGLCVEVGEAQMDAVTGLSGSGPAYGCLLIEALADGGVRMGLRREVALQLAAQTLLGAARWVLESGEHPAVLRDRVVTPGGTTAAGLAALEAGAVRSHLIRAVEAAARRSAELGRP